MIPIFACSPSRYAPAAMSSRLVIRRAQAALASRPHPSPTFGSKLVGWDRHRILSSSGYVLRSCATKKALRGLDVLDLALLAVVLAIAIGARLLFFRPESEAVTARPSVRVATREVIASTSSSGTPAGPAGARPLPRATIWPRVRHSRLRRLLGSGARQRAIGITVCLRPCADSRLPRNAIGGRGQTVVG